MTEDSVFLGDVPDSPGSGRGVADAETAEFGAFCGLENRRIGPYRLIRRIAEGGMGVVYLAEQDEPISRQVALKIVRPELVSDRILARFNAEREVLALMDHHNIAHVLDAGLAEGNRPYFVMDLVPGLPITEFCDQHELGIRDRARLMVTVCRAVQHAHQKGIIHRDIKPSNVLVMSSDDGPIPMVIDFGVAKAIDAHDTDHPNLTAVGHAVGTPLYMSPEQAGLAGTDVDTRSDVYSLGVLLYELVTGTTPITNTQFREMDPCDLRLAIWRGDPPVPSVRLWELGTNLPDIARRRGADSRALLQSVRNDLDRIIGKATSKNRNDRYPTANGLARDLERYLDHQPVEAGTPSALYRFRRFVGRHRATLATVCVVACALLVATVISVWQAGRATSALRSAEAASKRLSELLYVSDMKVASDAWQDNDPPRVAGLLRRHVPVGESNDLRRFEWHYLSQLVESEGHSIDMAKDDVEAIRFAPDGSRFASGDRNGDIRIYDAATGERIATIQSAQVDINDLAFSPDGASLAAAGSDGTVRVWNPDSGQPLLTIPAHDEAVRGVVYAADGVLLASCGLDNHIRLWDASNGTNRGELRGHERGVEALALSPDGRLLASAGNDATLRLWDLARLQAATKITLATARMVCVAFSHDGRFVAGGDIHGNVVLHQLESGISRILVRLPDGVESLVFLKDDRWLATGDRGGSIQFWPVGVEDDLDVGLGWESYPRWQAHDSRVTALALGPGGSRLVSGSRAGRISEWSSQPATGRWVVNAPENPANDLAFVHGASHYALIAGDQAMELWDIEKRAFVKTWGEGEGPWRNVAFSSLRKAIIAGNERGEIVAWSLDSEQELARWDLPGSVAWESLAFAPDGHTFAVAGWDRIGEARVLDLDDPSFVRSLPAHQSRYAEFSPDGRYLGVAWMDDALLYDLQSDGPPRRLYGHSNTVSDVAFDPGGKSVATVGHDRKLRLWDAVSGVQRYAVVAHRDWVRSVAFAPDGWSLATAGDDGVVRLWHAETGQLLLELPHEDHGIRIVRFCAGGRCLVCVTADHRVVFYDSNRRPAP